MPIEFGVTEGAHFIPSFRAFVSDSGMPGVRLTKEDGAFVDVFFSGHGIQELQRQLSLAIQMASSSSRSQH